jgi:hypothetical protein
MSLNVDAHEAQLYVQAFSRLLEGFRLNTQNVTRNAYAQTASEPYLEILGRQRLVNRLPDEVLEVYAGDILTGGYRRRVVDAFELARGRGNLDSIKETMTGLGYVFNSTVASTPGAEGSYNIIVPTAAGVVLDGTWILDGNTLLDAVTDNCINFELIQAAAVTQEQKDAIRSALYNIIRASARITLIVQQAPA